MRRWRNAGIPALITLAATIAGALPVASQPRPAGYLEADNAFQVRFDVQQRILFQVLMTTAGYWNAVPNENFSQRLFNSIQRFQSENGFTSNGSVDKPQLDHLISIAAPILDQWGFRNVTHPSRRRSVIWVPFGLSLTATRNEFGLSYSDHQKRVKIEFTTVPDVSLGTNYAALVDKVVRNGAKIHYRVMKDGWYVISATTPDGIDYYIRYHQDGTNVTGFSLSWNNANGNVLGERIAILMSASLWSSMTGASFIDPILPAEPKIGVARPSFTPPASQPQPSVADSEKPKETGGSSGTGFFVARDGSLLTNAHVVDGCSIIQITPDGASRITARLVASDKTNDLALLKADYHPDKIAAVRIGIRLGEPVATFGFPLSSVLATTGNFTLGNVTALAGLGDDTRHIQVSAPVQPGNSGGPLLDHQGNLIGVVTYKLNAVKTAVVSGDIPQNVNFAIKASAVASFLESNRVTFETGTTGNSMGQADLADRAKAMSAFITCN